MESELTHDGTLAGGGGWDDGGAGGAGGWNDSGGGQGSCNSGGGAAPSQGSHGSGKGGKRGRSPTHHHPLNLGRPAPSPDERMRLGQTFLTNTQTQGNSMSERQLIVQIANGDHNGLAQWWDAPDPVNDRVRQALYHNERRFEMVHAWGNGNTTNYDIDLEAMTSRNPDSGKVRSIRCIVVAMWA